jgi:hypothetical protein
LCYYAIVEKRRRNSGGEDTLSKFGRRRRKLDDSVGQAKPCSTFLQPLCPDRVIQAEIQALYATHRTARNVQQKEKFLAPNFKELIIDQVLLRLEDKSVEPRFQDLRNCFVFWARPPDHVVRLAVHLQNLLKETAPGMAPYHRNGTQLTKCRTMVDAAPSDASHNFRGCPLANTRRDRRHGVEGSAFDAKVDKHHIHTAFSAREAIHIL